ncbi:MAG: FtsK/SpoIIIE domain-containing protein [Actinomycetota bacterium]
MRVALTVRDDGGCGQDVLIVAPDGSSLDDVAPQLGQHLGTPARQLWNGTRPLPPSTVIGGPGLLRGDIVQLGPSGQRDLEAGAVLRLHVVGGPDAGLVVALPRGVTTIGRARGCDVELTDPDVSRQHLSITVTSAGISARDLGSTHGVTLDGSDIDPDGSDVLPGQLLRLGDSLISVTVADEPAAAVRAGPGGVRGVNRPPRLDSKPFIGELELPVGPASGRPQRIQWMAALLPAIAGAWLALGMHNMQFLAFMLLSPLAALGSAAGDRLHWRRSRRLEATSFRARSSSAAAERVALLAEETRLRRREYPDPAAVLRTASTPDCRLWERRRADQDSLQVRVGFGDAASRLQLRAGTELASAGTVHHVPVCVDLRVGPLGIAGPHGIALGTARWVIGQLATLHSPADLDLALLLSDGAAPAWTWTRWLPHLGSRVAITPEERQGMVARLLELVDGRRTEVGRADQVWAGRWLILVLDRSGALAELPGLARLLSTGPAVGVTAVCLDEEQRRLPTACASVARVCGETGSRLTLRTAGGDEAPEVIQDRVCARWAERVARALAPLVDDGADCASTIPDTCRLAEFFQPAEMDPLAILARWQTGEGLRTPVGMSADGPIIVDLVADGPHALIAGTTGAGKSELLQSLVMGLALTNSPNAVSFVLIDYKGGAAFADCADLPHTVGLVTDLDPYLTRRALHSLEAELRRREELFARVGAADLNAFRRTNRAGEQPVTRLVIVVDEFAALAQELPDFVTGLVGIAQRGRSLGIHLVLATQRPGGAISPEIRANTALRIALRVTDPGESSDVIGSDQAARIEKAQPGRAFVRTGSSLQEMQTGRVGGAAPIGVAQVEVVALDEWARPRVIDSELSAGKTDLLVMVDAVREAAHRASVPPPRRPWLPALTDVLPLRHPVPTGDAAIDVGLVDQPDMQSQQPLTVDLQAGGSVLIVGGPRSGRTTALRTIAARAAQAHGPAAMHLYVVDCAGGGLRALGDLQHCRATLARADMATVDRLLRRLAAEVGRRQSRLAAAPDEKMPRLLLLVDGWEALLAASDDYDTGQSVEVLLTLLRDAASARLTVVVSGDRAALAPRLAGNVACKYVLRLADPSDYALAGIPARLIPDRMPPGRAVRVADGAEVQFGFVGADPGHAGQAAALAQIASTSGSASVDADAAGGVRIRPLPAQVRLATLSTSSLERTRGTLLGIGGDEAQPIAVDLSAGDARWLVAGPPKSGRSTVLTLILRQAIAAEHDLVVAAPRRSPLCGQCGPRGIALISPDDATDLVVPPRDRPLLLLIDDSEAFLDTAAGDALAALAKAAPAGLVAVAAGRSDDLALTYRGIAAEIRRSHTGVLLAPSAGDGDLFGVRLPRTRAIAPPGRGVLIVDHGQLSPLSDRSGVLPIQIALP